jgi:hypothetical protein
MQGMSESTWRHLAPEVRKQLRDDYQLHCQLCAQSACEPDLPEHYLIEWLEVRKIESREAPAEIDSKLTFWEQRNYRERYSSAIERKTLSTSTIDE